MQAAGLPVAVETSGRVFTELGGLREGQTRLINSAAGEVGTAAFQLARARGARVIGTPAKATTRSCVALGAEPTT